LKAPSGHHQARSIADAIGLEVVVLEYQVHGESAQSGHPYDNRFVSIVTVKDGEVKWWRDYLDPIAVSDAIR
jgi:ketosteroid isomerase-like protein